MTAATPANGRPQARRQPGRAAVPTTPPRGLRLEAAARQDLVPCPGCGGPAGITDRFTLPSTDGPVPHVAVRCAAGHCFRLPADWPPDWPPAGRRPAHRPPPGTRREARAR